jgi:hypothetical protein
MTFKLSLLSEAVLNALAVSTSLKRWVINFFTFILPDFMSFNAVLVSKCEVE